MIRILELSAYHFSSGGIESFLVSTLSHMNREGLEFDFFTPYTVEDGTFTASLKSICSEIHEGGLDYKKSYSRITVIKTALKFLKNKNYNIIHIHSSQFFVTTALTILARKSSNRVIVHCHGTDPKNSIRHLILKTLCAPLIDIFSTDCCACSLAAAKCKYNNRSLKRLIVLNNGIDLTRFKLDDAKRQEYRRIIGASDNEKVIGHVARFDDNKNQAFLVERLHNLLKNGGSYKLLLIGDGETLPNVKSMVNKLQLKDKVIFTGGVSNVQDYMQAMDLFCLPSLLEGFPIVGVEAQACGLPVIFSDTITKEIKLTDNVEFVSLDDKESWEMTMNRLSQLSKADTTALIREAGYDIIDTANKVRELYLG